MTNNTIIKIEFLNSIDSQALKAHKNEIRAKVLIHQNEARDCDEVFDFNFTPLSIHIIAPSPMDNKSCNTISTFMLLYINE
jgi:hypothetical protein